MMHGLIILNACALMFKKQKRVAQDKLWVDDSELALPDGSSFYDKLNAMLDAVDFDEQVHALCQPYYYMDGPRHSGVDPAAYFCILFVGLFVQSWSVKVLLRKRMMHVNRNIAHVLDADVMQRTTLRCQENVRKRHVIAALGYNPSIALMTLFSVGTPKQTITGAMTKEY